ncbi:MAG: type II toxin-antitoxin system VapC family toxin [Methyloversatilis sp.]|uniref:type II toxin-antitoxin system tRNA(fMet)-specific endonuclease VapC n=1 Tax=Methyloversatilis sp. TaxID=2569862 RepID=UPI0027349489|nr:type II toxin-antitoxin system VapC family toxin [Methyloversatilis sp.]MDP2868234.1 type II toxin-antitoxin system VapC family toxin [Methyloversatilis sp.]
MAACYLLDTNICIYIAKHNPPAVRARFEQHLASELAMSVITLGELRHGAEKSQTRDKSLATIGRLEASIRVAPVTEAIGRHYGQIRAQLEVSGLPIGNNDLWIAAHARAEGWVLVTNNERKFSRVEGLQIENWVVA